MRCGGLSTGEQINVVDVNGGAHRGLLTAVSEDSISLQSGSKPFTVERARVRRVQVRSGARRLRNALIGAGIGFAIGLTVDQTFGKFLRNESSGDGGRGLTYATSIGVLGGIGAAMPGYRTVYRSR